MWPWDLSSPWFPPYGQIALQSLKNTVTSCHLPNLQTMPQGRDSDSLCRDTKPGCEEGWDTRCLGVRNCRRGEARFWPL